MFGHLTPPDGTEDTVEQEVLNLFAEPPGPSTAALPPTRTAGGGGGGWAGAGKGLPGPPVLLATAATAGLATAGSPGSSCASRRSVPVH
ncbi:hypothetical protein AAGT00_20630 [Streptomyces cavourensis]